VVREQESENRDYINVQKRYVDIRARKSRLRQIARLLKNSTSRAAAQEPVNLSID